MEMTKEKQIKLAENFLQLHHQDQLLILPNVWNAGGAKIFEQQGFKAIATTSAGIAYALGFPDGEKLTINDLILTTQQITQRISVPLSVDMEKGYGKTAKEVKNNVRKIIEAGAVGVNIEDGNDETNPHLDELPLMIEKIHALVELKKEMGIPFVINARTCAFWLKIGEENTRIDLAIKRTNVFVEAGADCVFLPGVLSKPQIVHLQKQIASPINIIVNSTFYNIKELEQIGVSRLSIGSGAARAALGCTLKIAQQLKNHNMDFLLSNELTYDKANQLFED